MSIRLPLQGVLDVQDNGLIGAASTAGGIAHPFVLPTDCDNVVVKVIASTVGGGVSVVFQTSDDGGTTWYDVARSSVVSNANGTTAEWMSIPVATTGINPQVISTVNAGSVLGGTIGSAAASTLGNRQVSGLPILGVQNRTFTIVGAGVTGVASVRTIVRTNSQAAQP